jgi:hypothetical protein
VNELRKIISLCLLLFLASCQSVQINDSSHIIEKDVVKVLEENGVILVDAEFSRANVFGSKLKNVIPGSYKVEEKPFFIYEFENEKDLEIGLREFAEKTATMDLVSSSMFRKRNILIFYVHEQDINSMKIPFEKEIQEGLNSIIEG